MMDFKATNPPLGALITRLLVVLSQ